jgi:hypothetical protein
MQHQLCHDHASFADIGYDCLLLTASWRLQYYSHSAGS